MIFRIEYETKTNFNEIVIPWQDVWNGKYRELLRPVFNHIRDKNLKPPKIAEWRDGLTWEVSKDVDLPNMPVMLSKVPKTKIKISEVFSNENLFTDGISTINYGDAAESSKT